MEEPLMGLLSSGPSAHDLKDRGLLVHDKRSQRWIDLRAHDEEALPCQHIQLAFDGGYKTCQQCGCRRTTEIAPAELPTEGEMLIDSVKGLISR